MSSGCNEISMGSGCNEIGYGEGVRSAEDVDFFTGFGEG